MLRLILPLVLLLSACDQSPSQLHWVKLGASDQEFQATYAACRAARLPKQIGAVDGCMREQGWKILSGDLTRWVKEGRQDLDAMNAYATCGKALPKHPGTLRIALEQADCMRRDGWQLVTEPADRLPVYRPG